MEGSGPLQEEEEEEVSSSRLCCCMTQWLTVGWRVVGLDAGEGRSWTGLAYGASVVVIIVY
jgi:hypothetical protein